MRRRRSSPAVSSLVGALGETPRAWSRAEIEERWSRATLSEAQRLGLAVRVAPAQFAHRAHRDAVPCRVDAAARWMGRDAAMTGLAALWLHGWNASPVSRVDVTLPRDTKRARPAFVDTFRTDVPFERRVAGGVATVSAEDAAIFAWRRAAPQDRRSLMFDILRDAPIDVARLPERIDAHARIPDRAGLSDVVSMAADGVQSMLEMVAATDVFAGPEWSDWERQGAVSVDGIVLHPDMLHRRGKVAVEFDGARFHGDDAARRADLERDALLASVGFSTLRFTWEDITRRPDWCRARARSAVQSHLGGPRG